MMEAVHRDDAIASAKHAERAARVRGLCPVTGKERFADQAAAEEEMASLRRTRKAEIAAAPTRSQRRKFNTRPVWKRAYECPWCESWHLTSEEERTR